MEPPAGWLWRHMLQVGERVDGTSKRFPAFAKDVARACVSLSEIRVKAGRKVRGIWHYG